MNVIRSSLIAALLGAIAMFALGCAEAQPACDNTCTEPGIEQTCAGGIATCKRFSDGCMYFGQSIPCPYGEVCVMSADGMASCEGQCPAQCDLNSTLCANNVVMVCETNADGCNAFVTGAACQQDQRCDGGVCVDDSVACEDECATLGDTSCSNNAVRECGDFDNDKCLDLGAPMLCGADETCVAGVCEALCEPECPSAGQHACEIDEGTTAYRSCIVVNSCLLWGDVEYCEAGNRCDSGACVPDTIACEDECDAAGSRCDGDAIIECGHFDSDKCLDELPPAHCDTTTQICEAGACVPRPMPVVVISELLYNSPGADDGPGNSLFVELAGPSGTSLEGMSLVGVNGSNGDDYQQCALSGSIPTSGYYVIAHPESDATLLTLADLTHTNVNFQNGSTADQPDADAVQLRLGTNVLDAVGYGLGTNAFGEGAAAEDSGDSGLSLSRDSNNTDTDHNSTDFSVSTASPGAPKGS